MKGIDLFVQVFLKLVQVHRVACKEIFGLQISSQAGQTLDDLLEVIDLVALLALSQRRFLET